MSQLPTSSTVLRMLLLWLQHFCFPNHRSAQVWESIRKHGVIMPGHDTPAAGWLLPRTGNVETLSDSVMYQGRRYINRWFRSEPGQILTRREFPLSYLVQGSILPEESMFVEMTQQNAIQLHYLTASL